MIQQRGPVGHILPAQGEDAVDEAFVYAGAEGEDEVGYIVCGGDVYDRQNCRVGHVAITETGGARIYRGLDEEEGWDVVTPAGDGRFGSASEPHTRGLVTADGEVHAGDCAAPVGFVRPPTNVHLMAAAALLLGLVHEPAHAEVTK